MRLLEASLVFVMAVGAAVCCGQSATPEMPRDYRGVQVQIPGIFITPVANAPFIATVDIVSHQKMADGTVQVRTTLNHIARRSSGQIYNERRRLVPVSFQGEPGLLSAHTYDPGTRLSTYLDPMTHLAREMVLRQAPVAPANAVPAAKLRGNALLKEEELGTQPLGGLTLRGIRKTRTIPAAASDTGAAVEIVDEYWYSPDLSIYMIIKHNDPRTGEQIVAVSAVERREPEAEMFAVPAKYKVVDETPVD